MYLASAGEKRTTSARSHEQGGRPESAHALARCCALTINPTLNAGSANPISGNAQYRIPTDNPFQAAGQVREIYAYGLRNPYRFAFDRANGQLILADVGQNAVEEIDRIVLGGNYGWATKEGDFLFTRSGTGAGRS